MKSTSHGAPWSSEDPFGVTPVRYQERGVVVPLHAEYRKAASLWAIDTADVMADAAFAVPSVTVGGVGCKGMAGMA
jgi:hypothetical protein